jgi:hypothetical protein
VRDNGLKILYVDDDMDLVLSMEILEIGGTDVDGGLKRLLKDFYSSSAIHSELWEARTYRSHLQSFL